MKFFFVSIFQNDASDVEIGFITGKRNKIRFDFDVFFQNLHLETLEN